jgi:methyl-accepting chemotaxis protein
MIRDEQTLFRRWLEVPARKGGKIQMGLIPGFHEMKESVEEAIDLLRRAVAALEKLAAEQERANDLFAEVNQASLAQAQNVTELSR